MPKFEKMLLSRANHDESFALEEVIDVNELVTRHALRKTGFDPAKIRLRHSMWTNSMGTILNYDNRLMSSIVYKPSALRNMDAEDFYVLLTHETAHLTQPPGQLRTAATAMNERKVRHMDDRWELDAQIWEARQATKFGWDDDRYKLFVDRIYGAAMREEYGVEFDLADVEAIERLGLRDRAFLQLIREEAEERPASFATMRRRPSSVAVRRHVRRRR